MPAMKHRLGPKALVMATVAFVAAGALDLGLAPAVGLAPAADGAGGMTLDVSWTRPGASGTVHHPPEVAHVGDTVTVSPILPGPTNGICHLTISADIGYKWRQMSVGLDRDSAGAGDDCPAWTFVLPPTPSGTYLIQGSLSSEAAPSVDLAVAQGQAQPFASSPYPVTSWAAADAFDSPPAFGTPMTISPPPGIERRCHFFFNGGGDQSFGSPSDMSCVPWQITIPELRPYPFMESGFEYPWETTYIFDGATNPDPDGRYFTTRSQVPFDMLAGGSDPASSDRPFVVWESSANPGFWTPGTVTAVPTLVGIDAGTCDYQYYVYPGMTTWAAGPSVPIVDGACAPLEFSVPGSALYGHVQYDVAVRDPDGNGISAAGGGANIVDAMQVPSLSAANSVVAGASLAVKATIDTGAPVGYTVTGTRTSSGAPTTAPDTTAADTTAGPMTTCGTGILDPTADTNTAKAHCHLSSTGYYTIRVTIRDASGHTTSRAKTVRVVPDTIKPRTAAPVARPRVGGTLSGSMPITLSLSGSDQGTGIARYKVARSRDGGAWALISSNAAAPSFATSVVAGHTYRFRTRAIDNAGNRGSWAYGPSFRVSTRQETAATVTPSWHVGVDAAASGGHVARSSSPTAKATFVFVGRSVAIVGPLGPEMGHARIYVDGVYKKAVDLALASAVSRRLIFAWTWRTTGSHRIQIRPVGDGIVALDAFLVFR